MSLDVSAAAVADEGLRNLVVALRARDASRLCGLFTANASLFGSQDAEYAIGAESLRGFFAALCAHPVTYSWRWEVTAAGRDGDVVWFVAPAAAELTGDDGAVATIDPYRLSGVLRRTGTAWSFELFNGSEPTT